MAVQRQKQTLGEQIKKDIKAKGLTETFVAKQMGITRQSINAIDTRKKFDLEFLLKLKKASGLDYTRFVIEPIMNAMEAAPMYNTEKNSVTLTLNVRCSKDDVGKFSQFLGELEAVAKKFNYEIV